MVTYKPQHVKKEEAEIQPDLPCLPVKDADDVEPELPSAAKQARKSSLSFLHIDDDVEISYVEPPLSLEKQAEKFQSLERTSSTVQL